MNIKALDKKSIWKEKFTGKVKYMVKVVDQPLIKWEY